MNTVETRCRKCGAPITQAILPNESVVDLEPNQQEGQALVLDGRAMFLSGGVLGEARRAGLPIFKRHATVCPRFWSQVDTEGNPL